MPSFNKYSEFEHAHQELVRRDNYEMKLARGFNVADIYLNRTYLDNFSAAPIIPPNAEIMDVSKIRTIEISKIVYDENEKLTDKLMSVYSALYSLGSSVSLIIKGDGNEVRFFLGVRSQQNVAVAGDILESTLKGNFPGIMFNSMNVKQTDDLLIGIKAENIKSLATVTIVPSLRDDDVTDAEAFVQGIEKFIDTMSGKEYTVVCLATPLSPLTIQKRKHGYEEMASALSPYAKVTVAYGKNESLAVNENISSSFSKSVNHSVSNTNSTNTSHSSGSNRGRSSGSNYNMTFQGDGASTSWGGNYGETSGSFDSYTSGSSFSQSFSESSGETNTSGKSQGETNTQGTSDTLTLTYENKGVELLIERATSELERFRICESFGMWEFACYFLSTDVHTTALASNAYRALMTGKESNIESSHLNIWSINQKKTIDDIVNSVLYLTHPSAEMPALEGGYDTQLVTPTNMVSGYELPLVMGLPKKSIAGLAVVEMAEFGRQVVYENKSPKRSIEFGSIYHMGVVEKPRVKMDLDLLASHCFITGSSGSGKSYATYHLLQSVLENDVNILIIEPAKGEYKQVFGGLRGIKIFTTDPNSYRMLHINPFQFPDNIHVLSHVEQLMQIFSASWSLTEAMPAFLKQAVVGAYVRCGWDTLNSIYIKGVSDHKYPTFNDVLTLLRVIIDESDYSAQSKGNYKGALLTRVEGMCTGINGVIFQNSEGVRDSILFDSNVVVDLSELGSEEAIALIMGTFIMKLNEYRKSQRKSDPTAQLNSQLKHITVLEEAHNLLKRTSTEQSQDGANMVGKSVEMISNSIKEMRTYGEGFVIIDQSPMAVDTSAIENTSTKIIMNTPAKDACEELGSALALNEAQTAELSKLNVGVAAVLQKGWLSPVLMKIDMWDDRYNADLIQTDIDELKRVKGIIVSELFNQFLNNGRMEQLPIRKLIKESHLPFDKQNELIQKITEYSGSVFNNTRYESMLFKLAFGRLLLTIIDCDGLFDIISLNEIKTFKQLAELESNNKYSPKERQTQYDAIAKWVRRFSDALKNYLALGNKNDIYPLIKIIVFGKNNGRDPRDNPNDKISIINERINMR